jgi:hypothetical protein
MKWTAVVRQFLGTERRVRLLPDGLVLVGTVWCVRHKGLTLYDEHGRWRTFTTREEAQRAYDEVKEK